MHHTLKITRRADDLAGVMDELDRLDAYGANTGKLAEVKAARKHLARFREMQSAAAADRTGADGIVQSAARAYADGTATVEDLRTAAVTAAMTTDHDSPLFRIYTNTQLTITARGVAELRKAGDKWVTTILRPLVDARVRAVMADIPPGMLSRVYPNDPESLSMLYGRLDAQRAHAELEQLHNIADTFRELAIIPATSRDNSSWQWATSRGERANANDDLALFVYLQREGHRAGIYTETEAAAAEAANPSRELSAADLDIARAQAAGIY